MDETFNNTQVVPRLLKEVNILKLITWRHNNFMSTNPNMKQLNL